MDKKYTEIKNILLKIKNSAIWIKIAGIVTFVSALTGILGYCESHRQDVPQADIQNQSMSVRYLSEIGDRQNKYPMFNDDVDPGKDYKASDNCATQVIVSNGYDHPILLQKIIFEAVDIEVDDTPKLLVYLDNESEDQIVLRVANKGWGDAEDVRFEFIGSDANLGDFIDSDKHSIDVACIKAGEEEKIGLWDSSDVVDSSYEGSVGIIVKCIDNENNNLPVDYYFEDECAYISLKKGKFSSMGRGAPGESIYGVRIDTSRDTYKHEYNISEIVQANDRLELPICFYPDKSCSLKFRVILEAVYNNKNETMEIATDWAMIGFQVSSIGGDVRDADSYDIDAMQAELERSPGLVKVTYPFADLELMERIQD